MAIDRRLLFVLHRASRAATAHANARLVERFGVSLAQLATLSRLAESPGCTMTDIADLLDLNKSAVSGMIQRLERAGLVAREPNAKDARAVRLHLTREGHEARRRAAPVFRTLIAELSEGFGEREVDVVLRFLNAVLERCGAGSSAEVEA
jgi:DNA-binding MarR family transcriptional regulator